MAASLSGCGWIPSADTMWNRKSIGLRNKTHLDGFALSPFSFRRVKTLSRCLTEDYDVIDKQMQHAYKRSWMMICISRQNEAGALNKPKGILVNWISSRLVQNADLSRARCVMPICQYPDSKSIVAKYLAPRRLSKASFTSGTGKASLMVTEFIRR